MGSNHSINEQILMFNGNVLENDNQMIEEYGIINHSVISLHIKSKKRSNVKKKKKKRKKRKRRISRNDSVELINDDYNDLFGNNFDVNGDLIVGAIKSSAPKKQKSKSIKKSSNDVKPPKNMDNKLSSTAYDELFGNIDDIIMDDNDTEKNISKCHHPSQQSIDMNPYLDQEYIFNVETDDNVIDVVHGFTKSPRDNLKQNKSPRIAEDELFDNVHKKKKKKRKKRKKRKSRKHRPS